MQGDLDSANSWADTFNDLPPDQALMWLEEPQVTLGTYPVNQGTWNRSLPGDPNFGCP